MRRKFVALCVPLLIIAVVLFVRPTLLAWAATALKYNQPVKANLGPGQSTDYTFDGKAGDRLTVNMNTTGGDLNPLISLYDPQGRLIGENNEGNVKDTASLQGIVLPADGTYRLVATNENKAAGGQFGLIVLAEKAKGAVYFDAKPDGKEFYQLSTPINHTNVTYRVLNTQPGYNPQDVENMIRQAFQAWAAVVPLTFQEVPANSQSDLQIQFANIDGPLNILGETCPPASPCAGQIQFDSSETWTMGPPQSEQDISFLAVATHEFGHAIGLLHSSDPNALMYYAYSPYNLKPGPDDIQGAQRLYGPGGNRAANSPTAAPPPSNGSQPVVQGVITDQRFAQFWDFDVEAGDTVTINMKRASGDLDSFLVLLDANNHILAYDDDGGGNRDAALRNIRFPQAGTYTVAATRYQQAQGRTSGNYTLSIDYNVPNSGNNSAPQPTLTSIPSNSSGSRPGTFVQVSQGQANSQAPSLDSVADQPFTDSLTPITQSANVTVQANQSYSWIQTWCAKDAATLQTNVKSIGVKFAVNGTAVDPRLITQTAPRQANNLTCVDYVVLLSNWLSGQQGVLTATMTLRSAVFDGKSIYAPGDYVYQYNVRVQ